MTPPRATYRLQLGPHLGFAEVAGLAGYLARLGASHVYLSPCLQAAPGSTHGYDVVDHSRLASALGGEAGWASMVSALREAGLGVVIDIVPNHMSVAGRANAWWWDVLENGPASRFADCFDVDWTPREEWLRDKVLLPVLGDHYGRLLEAGDIRLRRLEGADFVVGVHERVFPASPASLSEPLARAAEACGCPELAFLADALAALPAPRDAREGEARARRHRDRAAALGLVARQLAEREDAAAAVDDEVARLNADPDALDAFLDRQSYRLAFWRAARHDLDYRRFFDIDDLAALRVHDPDVFARTHRLIIDLVERGEVQGLRIDHVDGLRDPEGYLRRLRQAAPRAWIVAEKILEAEERLPRSWPIDGTTGYELIDRLGGLFVDARGEPSLTATYEAFIGAARPPFERTIIEAKRHVLDELLGSDLNRLTGVLAAVCERHRRYRDFTREDLKAALAELLATLPVYRTYIRSDAPAREEDVARIDAAVARAREESPELDPDLLGFLRELLCGRIAGEREAELLARFHQLSGPAMAKGLEDTALYRDFRLCCLNEVGVSPDRFGTTVADFHAWCAERRREWPGAMLTTSTHDTKRGEDVRLRIALLSECAERWGEAVVRWSGRAERHRADGLPDRPTEYLLYQTLVGAWPIEVERVRGYLIKAAKEAKVHTSWRRPDEAYEAALAAFVDGLLGDEVFLADLEAFLAPLREPARIHSLAQTLVRLTAPGVPDTYQGNELFHVALTDPDNRRPVDFARREAMLASLERLSSADVWRRAEEGLPKLWTTARALALRARSSALGPEGAYEPLAASGRHADRVVAFVRGGAVVTCVPRLVLGVRDWGDTTIELPPGRWRDALGEPPAPTRAIAASSVRVAELWERFPVALLERSTESDEPGEGGHPHRHQIERSDQ